jgi:hypothetical protein
MDALTTLSSLARGRLLEELSDAMLVVAEEVINTGKKGKVTLSLTITQSAPGEPSVVIAEEIKRTAPLRAPLGAMLFLGEGPEFHRRDPRQPEMDFRVLEGAPEVRTPAETEKTVRGA